MRRRDIILTIAAATMICLSATGCGYFELTGGTSDVGNPEKVTGFVVNTERRGIGGVPVRLCKKHLNSGIDAEALHNQSVPAGDTIADNAFFDTTDGNGFFSFSDIPAGSYNLIGNSQEYLLHVYYGDIGVDSERISLDTIPVREPGKVLVVIPDSVFASGSGGTIAVAGTPITYPVASAGPQLVNVPAGKVNICYLDNDGTLQPSVIDTSLREIAENDTADLTNESHVISRPLLMLPDTGVVDSAVIAQVCCAYSNKLHSLEYRFSWNGELSGWSIDTVGTHVFALSGKALIMAQARSRSDTLTVSMWSDSGSVEIVDTVVYVR